MLNKVHACLGLERNERHEPRLFRICGEPRTTWAKVVESREVIAEAKVSLIGEKARLSPFELKPRIDAGLRETVWIRRLEAFERPSSVGGGSSHPREGGKWGRRRCDRTGHVRKVLLELRRRLRYFGPVVLAFVGPQQRDEGSRQRALRVFPSGQRFRFSWCDPPDPRSGLKVVRVNPAKII